MFLVKSFVLNKGLEILLLLSLFFICCNFFGLFPSSISKSSNFLSVGGLKEKLLAAHRAGIKQVLIPKDNEKDLVDIPQKVKDDIKITPAEVVEEVLKLALTKEFKKVEWTEIDNVSESKKEDKSQASIQ